MRDLDEDASEMAHTPDNDVTVDEHTPEEEVPEDVDAPDEVVPPAPTTPDRPIQQRPLPPLVDAMGLDNESVANRWGPVAARRMAEAERLMDDEFRGFPLPATRATHAPASRRCGQAQQGQLYG
ncbi:hypothetical protein NW754_013771 [Fusarium falciforme]|nr:hypothetical protein NW754_013771 [Fusarium falciforme]